MEKSRSIYSTYQLTHPQSDVLKISHNIITHCNTIVTTSGFENKIKPVSKKLSKIPAYVFDPNQPNPQDQEITDKYVEKLRQKSKRQEKHPSIRKSQLGESQLIFTKEQQMKLEVIDQILQKGLQLPDDPFNIQLYPTVNIEELDLQTCIKQSNLENPYKEQLEEFDEWGKNGNKENVIELLDEYGRQCIENIDMKYVQKHKEKKKKQLKLLTFTKNFRSKSSGKRLIKIPRERTSIQVEPQKSFISTVQKIATIAPKIISQFETQKYINLVNQKKFPYLHIEANTTKFHPNLFKKMEKKQKICQMTQYISSKYLKTQVGGFMTSQRLQALYNCEIMKGAKQLMSNKDYLNLEIEMIGPNNMEEKRRKTDENFEMNHNFITTTEKEKSMDKSNEEIQKILEKNMRRLRAERQRVIQKLRC